METLNYTSVDRIFSKIGRDLKGEDNIDEIDVIEWIGEALEFLKVHQIQEQSVQFIEVKNNEAFLPKGLQMVLQIAKDNEWSPETPIKCMEKIADKIEEKVKENTECVDCGDHEIFDKDYNLDNLFIEHGGYETVIDAPWNLGPWVNSNCYKERFTPVRLANNTFFNSIVCKEKGIPYVNPNGDDYTIVGVTEKKFRFSFEEGYVAVAYVKNALDKDTGYPLIPDNISYISAITYYIKWKIAEKHDWSGREGWSTKAEKAEQRWIKYCRQAKNYMKMPKSIDQYQNLLEQSHYLIPRHNRYYGYFGNLGRREDRSFNNPDRRNSNYERHQ